MWKILAKIVSEKKKKGFLRSSVGGIVKAGGATVKGTAKIAGKSTQLAAKGTYAAGKATTKATYATGKVAAKGSFITMRAGGKAFLLAARKAYPRNPNETKWQYRTRMAKLGFKVSILTGKIIMALEDSPNVVEFARRLALDIAHDTASDTMESLALDAVKYFVSKEKKESLNTTNQLISNNQTEVVLSEAPPLPPGLNVPGSPPPLPPGLNVPGAPPPVPPGLIKGPAYD